MKKILFVGCAVTAASAYSLMEPATPESQGVSSEAILRFIDGCEKTFDAGELGAMHGFVIVRHGKVIAEGSWKPFDTLHETHMLYSHSKSFTSSAVGLLVDEGRLDLDERVVDIFSNDVPAKVSENLAQLRVRDLLTMNVGKKDHVLSDSGNWVREFLAQEFFLKPGTGFKYDSDATYMLAAIVERKSGERMMDYLKRKMFDRIGITKAWSTTSPQGIPCGGWGMNMTTRELARFGLLYLNRGQWDGQSVLSPLWVDLATARHTWSGWKDVGVRALGEGGDWEQGYGFQFWRCTHGAYRADGAGGQYTVVMPDQDMVVSAHANTGDFVKELDLVWDDLLPAAQSAPLPENPAACAKLRERLANLRIAPPAALAEAADAPVGKTFAFKDNKRGFRSVRLDVAADGWTLKLVTPAGEQSIPVGNGVWAQGAMRIDTESYENLGGFIGEHRTAAAGGLRNGKFFVRVYFTRDAGNLDLTFSDGRVSGLLRIMRGCPLESNP